MLIKEYHIPLPLSLEEYRIAQLYMIQKKSREESEGHDSAVEILENKPYSGGPRGSGQYTYKVFHIGRHLPSWFRSIAPKTALEVHEESWNAYPYTKTKFSVPYVEKFSLEVETLFEPDNGSQDNIFQLQVSELRQREVDVIDIVNDQLSGSDYKQEEDPRYYTSEKTGRGPLADDWIQRPPNGVIMCAYKLIKVEFRYWGLQSKVERFIHDYGLRRVMLRAHRQAWAWQDEWVGLTMKDIRRLERETQLILRKKLGRVAEGGEEEEEEDEEEEEEERREDVCENQPPEPSQIHTESPQPCHLTPSSSHHHTSPPTSTITPPPLTKAASEGQSGGRRSSHSLKQHSQEHLRGSLHPGQHSLHRMDSLPTGKKREMWRDRSTSSSTRSFHRKRSEGPLTQPHVRPEQDSDTESMYSTRPEWILDSIAIVSESDSELEFFDAQDTACASGDSDGGYEEALSQTEGEGEKGEEEEGEATQLQQSLSFQSFQDLSSEDEQGLLTQPPAEPQKAPVADLLFLVVQGGATIHSEASVGRNIDYQTLSDNMAAIAQLHFHSAVGRLAMRQVPCPNLTTPAFQTLCDINPVPVSLESLVVDPQPPATSLHVPTSQPSSPTASDSSSAFPTYLPISAMPLLATQNPGYVETLRAVSTAANRVFQEFLQSPEGCGFSGQVCLITDCMGSIVAYDILTSPSSHSQSLTPSPTIPSKHLGKSHKTPSPHSSPPSPRQQSLPSPHPSLPIPLTPPANPRKYSKSFSEDMEIQVQPSSLSASHKKHRYSSSASSLATLSLRLQPPEGSVGFDFEVTHFFSLGSPLGLVLASRQMQLCRSGARAPSPPRPNSAAFYNLYYGLDPLASRVEPLLDCRFSQLPPIAVPVYSLHPKGLAEPSTLQETVIQHPYLFESQVKGERGGGGGRGGEGGEGGGRQRRRLLRKKSVSTECMITVEEEDGEPVQRDQLEQVKPFSVWWSRHRLDYLLTSPLPASGGDILPATAITHVIHSSYWEAKEIISFILRQVLHHDSAAIVRQTTDGREVSPFIPPDSVVKWNRKRTNMKIQRLSSNHRANDVLALDSGPLPTLHAKFQYGPLDMVSLAKEMVDVFVLVQKPKQSSWQHLDTMVTDKHGRLSYTLTEDRRLPSGLHPFKFLVKGDHTTAGCNMFVVPPHTEAVVFSVDGALAANFPLSARDMKCKPWAVEVARYWKDLGFLLVYLSGRPDMQKEYIMTFLATNAFPLGLVACSDTISTDSHLKTLYLARLIREAKVIIQAAYGSQRHLSVYKELGMQKDQIYIHGKRNSKKPSEDCLYVTGYQEHLTELTSRSQRPAVFDVYTVLGRDTCFALPGNQKPERRRKRSRDAMSLKKTSPRLPRTPSLRVDHIWKQKETTV